MVEIERIWIIFLLPSSGKIRKAHFDHDISGTDSSTSNTQIWQKKAIKLPNRKHI
jgi:hypothetical protein